MADKSPEALIREKVVAAGGGGRVTDTGDTGAPPTADAAVSADAPPTPEELEEMLTQMRRMNRKDREMDEEELSLARTERDRDDIRYRMLWGDVLYRDSIKQLSGRGSSDLRSAEKAMRGHVDMMNDVYGTQIGYPKMMRSGDPIPQGAVPVHEVPSDTTPTRVRGAGRLMTPEELDQP